MKVSELPAWPPTGKCVSDVKYSPPPPTDAVIHKTIFCRDRWLTFVCVFDQHLFVYDYAANDSKTAAALKSVLDTNSGKSLDSIGEMALGAS